MTGCALRTVAIPRPRSTVLRLCGVRKTWSARGVRHAICDTSSAQAFVPGACQLIGSRNAQAPWYRRGGTDRSQGEAQGAGRQDLASVLHWPVLRGSERAQSAHYHLPLAFRQRRYAVAKLALAACAVNSAGEALEGFPMLDPGLPARGTHLDQQRPCRRRLPRRVAQLRSERGRQSVAPIRPLARAPEHLLLQPIGRRTVGLQHVPLLAGEAAVEAGAREPAAIEHVLGRRPRVAQLADSRPDRLENPVPRACLRPRPSRAEPAIPPIRWVLQPITRN